MKFELSQLEIEKLNSWKQSLPELPADVFGEDFQFEYIFIPTGVGMTIKVRRFDGEEIDLTDYNLW